ncbi:MAG TPA: sigma-70 family RNA polymerase sigma factor [Gaiellaceae bacterium]|jgi:RNA polymerase sigma factor (sigma-70 family)
MRSQRASLDKIEHVYRKNGSGFLRLALAATGDVERARDALQEGFARAIRSRETFRGTGPIEAWVARCVLNAAHDTYAGLVAVDGDGQQPEIALAHSDGANPIVREAIARLPRRQRDALFLRYYLDFDYRSIAEALGVEKGTVSATLHAAKAALAEVLQEVDR